MLDMLVMMSTEQPEQDHHFVFALVESLGCGYPTKLLGSLSDRKSRPLSIIALWTVSIECVVS